MCIQLFRTSRTLQPRRERTQETSFRKISPADRHEQDDIRSEDEDEPTVPRHLMFEVDRPLT